MNCLIELFCNFFYWFPSSFIFFIFIFLQHTLVKFQPLHHQFLHQNIVVTQVHDLWVLPIQIGLALAILYSVVGLATLTGLATMVAIMVICTLIAHKLQSYTVKTMACKDARIKVTNEAINNMKIIKLQAWQDKFLQKVRLHSLLTHEVYFQLTSPNCFDFWKTYTCNLITLW